MNDIRAMRRLTILCPLLTLLIAVSLIGYQLHRRACAQAEFNRLSAQYLALTARFQKEAPGSSVQQVHEPGDTDEPDAAKH